MKKIGIVTIIDYNNYKMQITGYVILIRICLSRLRVMLKNNNEMYKGQCKSPFYFKEE
jgi:hypothetical protein